MWGKGVWVWASGRFLSWVVGRGVDAPFGASTPWATGRSSLVGKWTRGREGEGRVRPEERGPCPSGDGFTPWRICDLPPQE